MVRKATQLQRSARFAAARYAGNLAARQRTLRSASPRIVRRWPRWNRAANQSRAAAASSNDRACHSGYGRALSSSRHAPSA